MVCIFLADGFEMIEALTPCDVLKRAGAEVALVSVTDSLLVTSTHGVTITCDNKLSDIRPEDIEMIILPGGMPGAENLYRSETLRELTVAVTKKGKPVGAICAAPFILGRLGLLARRKATCYPGFEKELSQAFVTPGGVVRDGNILTAKGMGVSLPFALAAVSMLFGEDKARAIAAQIMAE
ncbi:MAG: DJ-1/PfpI family protein [Clostridia bacterium]|nr:DJ-1/PfpI family protein [Clostridia bacterium]